MKKTVVIHVLGYRAFRYLEQGSLNQMIEAAKRISNCSVYLVFQDNYSQDGSIQVAMNTKNIDVLLSTENLMYTGGINSGLQYIEYRYHPDYVILADADNFCEKETYQKLMLFMEQNPKVGMTQPLVVSKKDHSHIYSCGHSYVDGIFCRRIRTLPDKPIDLLDLKSCSICSSIIRMDILRRIGLLNECFKIYYESSDLSFRIRKAGYLCACNQEAIAYNEGTAVSTTANYHEAYYRRRNGLLFWYMHDKYAFLKMKEICLKELELLMKDYNDNEFCTDCIKESTRKGIIDGLALCEKHSPDELRSMTPWLNNYNKSRVIVLCQGDEIHRS